MMGILASSNQINLEKLQQYIILGELALDGRVRPVKGILPISLLTSKMNGIKGIILPKENAPEAALVKGLNVFGVDHLSQSAAFIEGHHSLQPYSIDLEKVFIQNASYEVDFSEVKGQTHAKRALEVAASGSHNILLN